MNKSKKKYEYPTESVKIKTEVLNKVREDKKETGVPIGAFLEIAAEEKLERQKKASKTVKK